MPDSGPIYQPSPSATTPFRVPESLRAHIDYRFAKELVDLLRSHRFVAYFAGGCVRDFLLGQDPSDFDIVTDATPNEVRDVCQHYPTQFVGATFGVVRVNNRSVSNKPQTIEVATFRSDGKYSDGRRPDSVEFATPELDAQRRDFTINGLYYDPVSESVIDFVGGRKDLEERTIRAIGVARDRITEDHLRLLRGIRFAARFHFELAPETSSAIRDSASLIQSVSPERIGIEFRKMLLHPSRSESLYLLAQHGLLPYIADPSQNRADPSQNRSAAVVPAAENATSKSRVNSTNELLKTSRPVFDALDFSNTSVPLGGYLAILALCLSEFELPNALELLKAIRRTCKLSNEERDAAEFCVSHLSHALTASLRSFSEIQPILNHRFADVLVAAGSQLQVQLESNGTVVAWTEKLLSDDLQSITSRDSNNSLKDGGATPYMKSLAVNSIVRCKDVLSWPVARRDPPPLVDGADLMALGVPRGPQFAVILSEVRKRQLDDQLRTKAEATTWLTQEFL